MEVEADIAKVDFISPTFSGLGTEPISESASLSEFESYNPQPTTSPKKRTPRNINYCPHTTLTHLYMIYYRNVVR